MKISLLFIILLDFVFSVVEIEGPNELIKYFKSKTNKDKISASYGYFGRIPYGYIISGKLYYDSVNQDTDMACKPMTNFTGIPQPEVDKNPIILIDRGNCSFVRKVKNVEKTGAKAAIIVNNVLGDISDFMMMDDGTGSDIMIPAVMISQEDGRVLQQFFKDNMNDTSLISKIHVSIDFEMLARRKARIDLFYSSTNFKIYNLLNDFSYYQNNFEHKDLIFPHLITLPHYLYNSNETKSYPNCLCFGKFCADPIPDKGITASDIIYENIRQLCVDKVGRDVRKDLYLKYILKFHSWCMELDFSKKCSESILEAEMKDESEKIKKCITDSFSSDNRTNYILENEMKKLTNYSIYYFPSILVNNRSFASSWKAENLLEAVCSGVISKPEICYNSGMFNRAVEVTGISVWLILFIIAVIISLNVLIYFCCKRYIVKSISDRVSSNDLDSRINNVVSSYIAFKDQEKK